MAEFFNIRPSPKITNNLQQAAFLARQIQNYIPNILVTLGDSGLIIARKNKASDPLIGVPQSCEKIQIRHYPANKIENVVNVSGAGDCFASGLVTAMLQGYSEEKCVSVGFAAAAASLNSLVTVPTNISEFCQQSWNHSAKFYHL